MAFSLMDAIGAVAIVLQVCGGVVIGLSGVNAIIDYARSFVAGRGKPANLSVVRLHMARGLVLGLEFLIGADILRTVLVPSWQDIAVLAAIIIIRTILSLSIEYEIRQLPEA